MINKKTHKRDRLCAFLFVVFCDIMFKLPPPNRQRKGVRHLDFITSFLISVLASVIAYYICKWLDREN